MKRIMTIPRVIHQLWIGNPMPNKKRALTQSMHVDGFQYKLWGNNDLTQQNFPMMWPYIVILQKADQPMAMIGDLMKYELVYHHGGFYFDINIELLRPERLASIAQKHSLVLCHEATAIGDALSCAFFAAAPNHSALKRVLDVVKGDTLDLKTGIANVTTGPSLFRRILDESPVHFMLDTHMIYPFPPGSKHTCTTDCKRTCPDSIAIDHFELGCSWCPRMHVFYYKVGGVCLGVLVVLVVVGILLYRASRSAPK